MNETSSVPHAHEGGRAHAVVDEGFVRASWRRSQLAGVQQGGKESPFLGKVDDSRLLRCAGEPLARLRETIEHLPVSIALSDNRARILTRFDNSTKVGSALDAVSFAPGFDYAETAIGTNGIGTVLASGRAAHIAGEHHFQERFMRLTCSGAPIRDPLTGRIEGVLDLSGISTDACVVMHSLVRSGAREIERALLLDRSVAQRAIFERFVLADARGQHAVFAAGERLSMANAEAQRVFTVTEQQWIGQHALFVLEGGRDRREELELPTGDPVRLVCRVVTVADIAVGVVCEARRVNRAVRRQLEAGPSGAARLGTPDAAELGATPSVQQACTQIERLISAARPVIVLGEPGTGRVSLVESIWRRCRPQGRVVCLDAESLNRGECAVRPSAQAADLLVLVRDVQRLSPAGDRALDRLLGDEGELSGAAVAATMTVLPQGVPEGAAAELARFEETVTVPALRHRRADIPLMVGRMLERRGFGGRSALSPEAMRVLCAHDWPGNLHELEQVVDHVLARRPVGRIPPEDLPASCFTQGRIPLGELERAERDAIVAALREQGGNRSRAAVALGISRSSLYRKLQLFGIAEC